jgi:hypothetical protein
VKERDLAPHQSLTDWARVVERCTVFGAGGSDRGIGSCITPSCSGVLLKGKLFVTDFLRARKMLLRIDTKVRIDYT